MYDALVIGAGPAGSNVSYQLSRKGFKVRIVDLKENIGVPNHCSGLVDRRVVDAVGEDLVMDRPQIAEISTPLGTFPLSSDRMRVIDRVALDQKLSAMAQSEGAELSLLTSLTEFHQKERSIVATLKSKKGFEYVEADLIIGADGPASAVRRNLGIRSPKLLKSLQFDLSRKSDRVKINLDREKTPDFFSWEVPNGNETEIGASGTNCETVVRSMVGKDSIVRKRGGLIPIGPTTLGRGSGFLVGDAAGLSKATTGGGLYAALNSGNTLASAISNGGDILPNYQRNWQKSFGAEVKRDYNIRRILDRFEKYYSLWFPLISANVTGINRVGDVDYPSKTLLYLLYSLPFKIPSALREFVTESVPS
ncbi:MAG: NAD(P)/FAD-dependent oxidoreductase [Thermoplasmatales archaeon]|nr:NAD(P)/FAD-dependent oxidoreductase [Candidatus Thermoplasmatota archaeon]MCL6003584.1 NAD(P)/FAD-dependent oxidoreductase [Candidatus Thermoplasmatota archaeon]MDA8054771.1 NAD(P)/FAD-dependent oxidoreductase [Thermoplasmatales archaeon]